MFQKGPTVQLSNPEIPETGSHLKVNDKPFKGTYQSTYWMPSLCVCVTLSNILLPRYHICRVQLPLFTLTIMNSYFDKWEIYVRYLP